MLKRRTITDEVIRAIGLIGKPVGDSTAPVGPYGWTDQATSNTGEFVPYVIVTPGVASKISQSFAESHADWQMIYNVSGFGVSRQQCEWIMDEVREVIFNLHDNVVAIDHDTYKIHFVDIQSIGSVQKTGMNEYPVFGETDTFVLWISREISYYVE